MRMSGRAATVFTVVATLVSTVVGTVTAAGSPAAVGQAAEPAVAPPTWVDCGGGFQCATVDVPADYRRPAAGTTPIGMIRLPASDPAHRIGSVFLNPGGPGASGVDFARAAARFLYSPALRARFDIVGFDPRGVGRSAELRCFTSAQEFQDFWADQPGWPLRPEQVQPYIRRTAEYTALCGQRAGSRLDHLSTVDVARDLDRLRAAVGDDKLTYIGYSYGSYLGEVYANLFPHRVRALALDGVLDPESWANQSPRMLTDAAIGGERSLDAFSSACAAAGAACPFANGDSASRIRQRLNAILEGTKQTPLPAPNAEQPGQLDYFLANGAYLLSMYDTFFWPTFAAGLAQAQDGDGSILLDFISLFVVPPDVYDNSLDMWAGVFCTDGTFPRNAQVWPPLVNLSERIAPTFTRYWWYTTIACATWPGRAPERYAGPWDRRTAAPILMLNTVADPATAYPGAVRAQRRMADARLVTVDGWGHTSLAHPSTCAQRIVDRYLIDTVAPANGTHCAPDAGPFDAALSAAAAAPASRPPLPWLPTPRGGRG